MISTPFLRIDEAIAQRNVQRLADYAGAHGIGVRPHTKTHKSLHFAQMQLAAGAVGLTVAKPGEAEVMAATDADLLLAYPTVDPEGCRRVAELARQVVVRVAVDSVESAQRLGAAAQAAGSTLGMLADLDVGMHRTGVQTAAQVLHLAKTIDGIAGLRLDGLFCYPGHIAQPLDQQAEPLAQVAALLEEALALYKRAGLDTGIVSGGSTPTAYLSHLIPQVTEIRSGTYIFNDMNCVHGGYCGLDDCAARFECTVVSDAVPGQVVIDAGNKTLCADICAFKPESGFGHVVEYPAAKITRLSEEHGQVDISRCETRPAIGERVHVIPNHVCPTVNLHDSFRLDRGRGESEPALMKVDARGRVS